MKTYNKEQKKTLRQIASFYGCKVYFINDNGGFYDGKDIYVGTSNNHSNSLSIFFHELAHFINSKTNKYPLYHDVKNFHRMPKLFKSFDRMVRYCLDAEIYTDKVGKELMKEWMPERKYYTFYKNDKACWYFMYGSLL